jgi:microcystin-dependent protein
MKQNIETLKEYFETGDKPTQQNYADLIDSLGMPMIGEIKATSFAFAPAGWAKCNGQLLVPADSPELFALIGTTYGGDGTETFALPDLCGRIPLGYGSGIGLSTYTIGQNGGEETHTLIEDEMPSHTHNTSLKLSTDLATNETPSQGNLPALTNFTAGVATQRVKSFGPPTNFVNGHESTTSNTGASQPHNITQPYLAVNYIIAVNGINPI